MIKRLRWAMLAVLCGSAAASSAMAASYSRTASDWARLLAIHNLERARVKAPPLQWDPYLAASAASYGPALARRGGLVHSPRAARQGQMENLWMGTRGYYAPEQMVGAWVSERAMFRPGVFPYVSRTGRWSDVGHYTQMIWKGTTRVGCAIHAAGQWEYLICRYSPPGNVDGKYLP